MHIAFLHCNLCGDDTWTIFDRAPIVKEDMSILSNPGCNPIIISSSLANDVHLLIGDMVKGV